MLSVLLLDERFLFLDFQHFLYFSDELFYEFSVGHLPKKIKFNSSIRIEKYSPKKTLYLIGFF